jgi:hypothetical protein
MCNEAESSSLSLRLTSSFPGASPERITPLERPVHYMTNEQLHGDLLSDHKIHQTSWRTGWTQIRNALPQSLDYSEGLNLLKY